MIPLNKNKMDGMIESAIALNILFFLKQIAQIAQYRMTKTVSATRYRASASSDHQPKVREGIRKIMKRKHP